MHKPLRTLVNTAVLGLLASSSVCAGGFSLYTEGNGYGIGNFGAGFAAEAADASTGWYNPAGLALIRDQQMILGVVGIAPSSKLSGTTTYSTTGFADYTQTFSDLQASKTAAVPSFHYARPLGDNSTFGLSVVAPFGLSTEYDFFSPVRYAATLTELITVNVSPEIGGRITEHLSIGAGIDLQYAAVKFNRLIGSPAALQAATLSANMWDSLSYNKGSSMGVGFHAGVLTMFNDNHTRVGLNYQSKMKHQFKGYSELTGTLADPNATNPNSVFQTDDLFSNTIELPDIATLSGYQDVNKKWALLGSVVYTGWGSVKSVVLNNVAAFNPTLGNVAVSSSSAFNYKNTWRFSVGANYHVSDNFMLRAGTGYDPTPTNDIDRDVRLPDGNRWALAVGGHYDFNPALAIDFGFTHLFVNNDPRINRTDPIGATSSYNVNATVNGHANLFGGQLVWHMDEPSIVS